MKAHAFPKRERIVSRKLIDKLFAGGQSLSLVAFPLRVVYQLVSSGPTPTPTQMLVSVPKRHFKHAVDRNRAKRQVREAYRLHSHKLATVVPKGHCLAVAFLWQANEHFSSAHITKCMKNLLARIVHSLDVSLPSQPAEA